MPWPTWMPSSARRCLRPSSDDSEKAEFDRPSVDHPAAAFRLPTPKVLGRLSDFTGIPTIPDNIEGATRAAAGTSCSLDLGTPSFRSRMQAKGAPP